MTPATRRTRRWIRAATGITFAVITSLALLSLHEHEEVASAVNARHTANAEVLAVERLRSAFALTSNAERGFLLTDDPEFLDRAEAARSAFRDEMRALAATSDEAERARLSAVTAAEEAHEAAVTRAVELREQRRTVDLQRVFIQTILPRRRAVEDALGDLSSERRQSLAKAERHADVAEARAFRGVVAMSVLALAVTLFLGATLLRASRKERESVERWTMFLSVASHDLKSPLATLLLRAQHLRRLVADGRASERDVLDGLAHVEGQTERMSMLVRSLLDASRVWAGALTVAPEETDLAAITAAVGERMRAQFERAGTPLSVSADEPIRGEWDPLRLEQVVTNLLANALQYGDRRPVEVRTEAIPAGARLVVRDHGPGIAREAQAHLFEAFARGDERDGPGHGLGLWITRNIVEAHRGHVRVESAPGQGAAFIVDLPRVQARKVLTDGQDGSRPGG